MATQLLPCHCHHDALANVCAACISRERTHSVAQTNTPYSMTIDQRPSRNSTPSKTKKKKTARKTSKRKPPASRSEGKLSRDRAWVGPMRD